MKVSYFPKKMDTEVSWLALDNKKTVDGMLSGVPVDDYKITGMLKILLVLHRGASRYKELYDASGFRMSTSFRSYLTWMQEIELIEKIGENKFGQYQITQKGGIVLELLSNA